MAYWKSKLEAQAKTLADCHRDLQHRDIEKELRHEQQVIALEREIVMLRASLQVAETTIKRLTDEVEAQRLSQQTLLDGAALLKGDAEESKRREEWQGEEYRRQVERNQSLMGVIDTMIRERDTWLAEQKQQEMCAAARREERLQAVTERVAELQLSTEALQLRVDGLQAENGLLRENNTRLVALLRQADEFEDLEDLNVVPSSILDRKRHPSTPLQHTNHGRVKARAPSIRVSAPRCCCRGHG
eukprot:GGOE01019492.1.p1 GENE.GGOE01019492.1~~GGOE01019492.1.p1  ORF type:complete len:244 (+),score=69.23 GGOE01019492.1:58-789(+)